MRRKIVLSLIVLNAVLACLSLGPPLASQILPRGPADCCQPSPLGEYCCYGCCWFTWDCDVHEDCEASQGKTLGN